MAGFSKSELLTWMRQAPRTLNWGAILAFNRTDTNTVLLQEYIDRFSTGHFLPPVQGYVGDSSTVGQYISDYVMDYPRLSFEIADVEKEIPDARLTMQVVGGTQVTFVDIPGGREATRIEVVDPLNGPALTLKVHLVDAPATVTSAGKVELDLRRSSDFSLSYSDFEREQRLGGEFFQELFEGLDDNQRVMVISEIKKDANNPIKPARLKIHTQAAPGAKSRSAENYGDGAVLVFVAMEGELAGGNPDTSFKYLIPNDGDSTATIILSNKLLLETLIGRKMVTDYQGGANQWVMEPVDNGFFRFDALGGHVQEESAEFMFGTYKCVMHYPVLTFVNTLSFTVREDGLLMKFRSWGDVSNARLTVHSDPLQHARLLVQWNLEGVGTYQVDPVTQKIVADYPLYPGSNRYLWPIDDHQDPIAAEAFEQNHDSFNDWLWRQLNNIYYAAMRHIPPINTLVLETLLFKNDNVVLDDVALPGDMAIFGRVGPSLTRFALDPLQPLIGTSETLQFNTVPRGQTGLTWKAENILGNTGDYGDINISTGLYKAPDSIDGAFLRVKVTASGGGYSSSALVSVVVNDITVSPLIQICDGGHTRTVSAGAKGTGALTGSLKPPADSNRLVESSKGKWTYTAPLVQGDKALVLEEIVIRNELTNKTKSAWVLATLVDMTLSVTRDTSASLPAGQTKLTVKASTSVIPVEAVHWDTLAGSGNVVNGTYTQPEKLEQRFVLLLATWYPNPEVLPDMKFQGFILLPLPLFDYPANPTPGLSFMAV